MIATASLVFWVPSVGSALAHVQRSPFFTVNYPSVFYTQAPNLSSRLPGLFQDRDAQLL
jgi:hypothetical protein